MIRPINIQPVLNGFVVKIGCQAVVFNTISELATNVSEYYKNPEAAEKSFRETALNKALLTSQPADATKSITTSSSFTFPTASNPAGSTQGGLTFSQTQQNR